MDSKKPTTPNPNPNPAPDTGDVVQLLLNVLRQVQNEVRTTRELSTEATAAIASFRAISADLATTPQLDPDPSRVGSRPK